MQKHIGQALYGNINTFNSVCWKNNIPKIKATPGELKTIRESDLAEQKLKKATLLSLQTVELLFKSIKRPEMYLTLQNLLKDLV
jgi:hypothetical protein